MNSPTADPNAPNSLRGLSAVRCSELVSLWHREEANSRKHAAQWESGDNWKNKPDPWMAEVCRMRADTLRLCAMQIEEANTCVSDGPADGNDNKSSAEGPFAARNG